MFTPPLITVPWASQGDTVAIPVAADPNGFVSFTLGYTPDYEISLKSGNQKAKAVERRIQNMLFQMLTQNVQAWQQMGFPAWSANMPGGYDKNAVVVRQNASNDWVPYRSLISANVSDPLNSPDWQYVESSSELLSHIPMPTGGGTGTGVIAVATDLNTRRRGTWYYPTDAIAAASANCPSQVAGMLESRDVDAGNTVTVQIYTDRQGRVYTRGATNNGGSWTAWSESVNRRGDAMTGALGLAAGSTMPTSAKLTSTTEVASTAFVRGEIGSYSGDVPISANVALDNASLGKACKFTAAGLTATLPPLSGTVSGVAIRFYNLSNGTATIVPAGSDVIKAFSGNQASIVLQPGDSVEVSGIGKASWDITGGTYGLFVANTIVPTRAANANDQTIANTAWVRANFVSSVNPTFTTSATIAGDANNDANLIFNVPAGRWNQQIFRRAGSIRWNQAMDGSTEGAGDTGSSFQLQAFDNNGVYKYTTMLASRADGTVSFPQGANSRGSPVWTQATLSKLSQLTNDVVFARRGSNTAAADGAIFGDLKVNGSVFAAATTPGTSLVWNEENGSGAAGITNNRAGGGGGLRIRQLNQAATVEEFRWDFQPNGTLRRVNTNGQNTNVLEDGLQGMALQADGNVYGVVWGGFLNNYIANLVNGRTPRGSQVIRGGGRVQYGPIGFAGSQLEANGNQVVTGVFGTSGESTGNAIYFWARDIFTQ
ncbi:tail fiber protein [Burkholderia phage Maja]|uniref:Tail fiber protein n=1 Tax=Burkholderia phage Maja TaxID=2767571 RepID=A0A7S6U096_9CAUD|nr:tail fiber protein [Burkholderia phage Maja]